MKKLLRISLILIAAFLFIGSAKAQNLDFDETRQFEFFARYDTLGIDIVGLEGMVSWDTTLFEYVGSDVGDAIDNVVLNDTKADSLGYIKFAWASVDPLEGDSHIVDIQLKTKAVAGAYTVEGIFSLNERPEPIIRTFMGEIGKGLNAEVPHKPSWDDISVWPNPANPDFNLLVTTPEPQYISIKMFDVLGREVKNMYDGHLNEAVQLRYTTDNMASGLYFFAIQGKDWQIIRRLTILK